MHRLAWLSIFVLSLHFMEAARAELEEAGQKRQEIDRLKIEKRKELDELHHKHTRAGGGTGSGRWKKHDQDKKDTLESELTHLEQGFLPSEVPAAARASASALRDGARQNAQHHAGGMPAPSGRVLGCAAGGGGGSSSSAAGGGGGGGGGNRSADVDDDDGVEDAEFPNYYKVSATQRAFNRERTAHFFKNAANLEHAYFDPRNVSKSGCDPECVGVGRLHVHAPHKYLGFELPPCPVHGWPSVEQGKVKTHGTCEARRVYALEIDEWVAGQCMLCQICEGEKRQLQSELDDLNEDGVDAEAIDAAEAAVKAKKYHYRSYHPRSLQLYAERYPGCASDPDAHAHAHPHLSPSPSPSPTP